MYIRKNLDISAYFVVGPENTIDSGILVSLLPYKEAKH